MISLLEYFKELIWPSYALYEMSNISPEKTGLPFQIWIQHRTFREGHWARIKVYPNGVKTKKYITISVEDNPKIKFKSKGLTISQKKINKVIKFVKLNKEILVDYWNNPELSTNDLIDMLKPVS